MTDEEKTLEFTEIQGYLCEDCEFADNFNWTCLNGYTKCAGTNCDDYEPFDKEIL